MSSPLQEAKEELEKIKFQGKINLELEQAIREYEASASSAGQQFKQIQRIERILRTLK